MKESTVPVNEAKLDSDDRLRKKMMSTRCGGSERSPSHAETELVVLVRSPAGGRKKAFVRTDENTT